jgi:hypothetical protein
MKKLSSDVCERCGANEHVHEGLCRKCRKALLGEARQVHEDEVEFEHEKPTHHEQAEPLHNPPWRRRGA